MDDKARALRGTGGTIEGLLVAGVDVGDVYGFGSVTRGGLGLALASGRRAAQTAMDIER